MIIVSMISVSTILILHACIHVVNANSMFLGLTVAQNPMMVNAHVVNLARITGVDCMAKIFYTTADSQRLYEKSILKLRKICFHALVLGQDTGASLRIYDDSDRIIERCFMVVFNHKVYLCYTHHNSNEIRTYRSYYPADDIITALRVVDERDPKDLDWIEILSLKNSQLLGRTVRSAYDGCFN